MKRGGGGPSSRCPVGLCPLQGHPPPPPPPMLPHRILSCLCSSASSYFFSSFPSVLPLLVSSLLHLLFDSSSSPKYDGTWRGGWPFPPSLSGALLLCGCVITPSFLPPAWCQEWGLRSEPKCLQSAELQTSLQRISLHYSTLIFVIAFF